jgi:alcohol dehydrogenase class IV
MPHSLQELGMRAENIPRIAQKALEDGNLTTNPVPLDLPQLQKLLQRAIRGRL